MARREQPPSAGSRPKPTDKNIEDWIRRDSEANGPMFRFDSYSGRVLLMRPVPRVSESERRTPNWTEPRPMGDADLMRVSVWIEDQGGMPGVNIKRLNAMIGMLAEDETFNSNRDRLLAFTQPYLRYEAGKQVPIYTGQPVLERYLINVCGVDLKGDFGTDEDAKKRKKYLKNVTKCFFVSMMARIMRPGTKVDTALILESGEGHQKSQFLRVLAFDRDDLFSDNIPLPLHGRDAELHLRGKMLVELPEAIAITKGDPSAVKAFLSTSTRQDRPVWGTHDVLLRRGCVFVVTTNDWEYLTSQTGNRRFWPVKIGDKIDLDMARRLLPQVYAEALALYLSGEPWWLDDDVEEIARQEQAMRETASPLTDVIRRWVHGQFNAEDAPRQNDHRGEPIERRSFLMPDQPDIIEITMSDLMWFACHIPIERQHDKKISTAVGIAARKVGGTKSKRGSYNFRRWLIK